jgi:Trypsin-co-occurring domain 2
MPEEWVGLADAIRELRRELIEAMNEGQGKPIRFELGPVEMEFLLEVSKDAGGEAGVKFWVISLGGKGSVSSGSTHRVKLSLTPKDASGGSPEIADTEATGEISELNTRLNYASDVECDHSNRGVS